MKATITCDSENTMRFIDYIIRTGSCNSRTNEMQDWGIDIEDTKLSITYSVEKPTEVEVTIEETQNKKTKEKKKGNPTLYAARCVETGKLVSDLTNPRRKYWDREANARKAIEAHNEWDAKFGNPGIVELVKFELVEVKDE